MFYNSTTSNLNILNCDVTDTYQLTTRIFIDSKNDFLEFLNEMGFVNRMEGGLIHERYINNYKDYEINLYVTYEGEHSTFMFKRFSYYKITIYENSEPLYTSKNIKETKKFVEVKDILKLLLKAEYRKLKIKKLLEDGK
jgi:hypothetical protein